MNAAVEVDDDQQLLFGGPTPALAAPDTPAAHAHATATDTERDAAHAIALRAGTLRALLLEHLVHVGPAGLTGSEAYTHARRDRPHVKETSVRPRLSELLHEGWAADSGRRRRPDADLPAEIIYTVTPTGEQAWRNWRTVQRTAATR